MDTYKGRRSIRIEFQTMADLRFSGQTFKQCRTRDLSLKSIYVFGISGPEPEEQCEITLYLIGGSSDVRLTMKAEVVRTDSQGLALKFTEIDFDSFIHLKNIMYYNCGDPDVLEKEWLASFSHAQE